MKIIAHRGASGYAPENTMAAINMALYETNCDGIEIDVHLTKDNRLIVIHDDTIQRTTDGRGTIKDMTYEQILEFNAYGKFKDKYPTEKVPSLDDVLRQVKKSGKMINVEIKNGGDYYPGIEEMVITKINEYSLSDMCLLSSFDHKAMKLCKEIDRNIRTGLLSKKRVDEPDVYAKAHMADAYNYRYLCLTKEYVRKIRQMGYELNCYTPNLRHQLKYVISCGVDGIITNYPDKAEKLLKRK